MLLLHSLWYQSGCRMEMYDSMLKITRKRIDCSLYVLGSPSPDIYPYTVSAPRYLPWITVLAFPRCHPRRPQRGMCLRFFPSESGRFTSPPPVIPDRITFWLTRRAWHVWEILAFRPSPVSAVRKPLHLDPMAQSGGWHQNSSVPLSPPMRNHPVIPPKNPTSMPSLWLR